MAKKSDRTGLKSVGEWFNLSGMNKITITTLSLLAAGSASAHPDHLSPSSHGVGHLLTDPFHVAMLLGTIGVAFALRRFVRSRRASR